MKTLQNETFIRYRYIKASSMRRMLLKNASK